MVNNIIKKAIALSVIIVSIVAFNPAGASAAWKQDKFGWLYTEGNSWAIGWKSIDGKWYYFSKLGYMETGWICDGHYWYYLNPNGDMVSNQMIDGNHINSSGACSDFISAEDAKAVMFKEDGVHANSLLKYSELVVGENSMVSILSEHYGINEEVYAFYFQKDYVHGVEFVGVKTRNVYRAGSNGGCPIYLIKNNTIVEQYNWID